MAYRHHAIDRDALTALARRLVRTPSPSGQEGDVAALVLNEMRKAGMAATVDRMGNVIGRIGEPGGRRLLYNAHMDTVSVPSVDVWAHDPFGGEIEGDVLYGCGAADMKGALASMIHAVRALVEGKARLAGELYLVAVVQEEPCEGAAMRHLVEEEGLRPDWVVLGEPTNLQLARGQRGRMEFQVIVQGRACHASAPQRGVNAIYQAARAIVGLELLVPQLGNDAFLGKGTIAVTEISSRSGSRNALPDACTLYVDRRLTNGETEAKAMAEVRRVLARESIEASVEVTEYTSTSYNGYQLRSRQYYPSWVTPANDPLLLAAASVVEDVLGAVPHVGRWEFSTDGVYTAGTAGIPTIGFGPGEERFAHTADEQVRLSDLVAAAQVYAQLAATLLAPR